MKQCWGWKIKGYAEKNQVEKAMVLMAEEGLVSWLQEV